MYYWYNVHIVYMYNLIKDVFFPKQCMNCGRLGVFVCADCVKKLEPVHDDYCLYCGKKRRGGETCERCCRKNGVDGVLSFYFYNETLQHCIHTAKYEFVQDGIRELFFSAPWNIHQKLTFYSQKDIIIVPVPLHPNRQRLRGFNQATIFAKLLATILNKPLIEGLERTKNTVQLARTQTRLERYYNIRNAFMVPENSLFTGKDVLVVDDILTSGSTVKEVTRILKTSGVKQVYICTLGRA